jgi:hypothetical protein
MYIKGGIFVMDRENNCKIILLMKKQATLLKIKLIANTALCCLLAIVLFSGNLSAQGWQQSIGSQESEEGWALIEDLDGGYLILGSGRDPQGDFDQDIFLVKLDIDGVVVWTKYLDNGGAQLPSAIARTADNNYIIVGSISAANNLNDVQLLKIDPRGNQIWSRTYGGNISESANDVAALADGGFVITGENDAGADIESDILVVRFDALGNARWQKTIGTERSDVGNAIAVLDEGFAVVGNSKNEIGFDNDIALYRLDNQGEIVWEVRLSNNFLEEGRDVVATRDGGIAIAGTINDQPDVLVAKFDKDGNQRWTRTLGNTENEEVANALTELADGSLVAAGIRVQADGINVDVFVAKVDAQGNLIWERNLGRSDYLDEVRSIVPTLDGGFALAGYAAPGLSFENDVVLIKTDALGNTLTNVIQGSVYQDLDGGCDLDLGETGLKNWVVIAEGEETTYYGTTDENGEYSITVDTGFYTVNVLPENLYWSGCRENGYPININEFYDTVRVDLAAVASVECPYLEVDISTPYLVRCDEIVYTVEYCNLGTAGATGAQVEVMLDNQLTFQTSALPVVQDGQRLMFDIGDVAAGACGSFQITTNSSCEGNTLSKAVTVAATIFPDTTCRTLSPNWDQSDIKIEAFCEAEEVLFQVTNIGSKEMAISRGVVVIENEIILSTGQFQLPAAQDTFIRIPVKEGQASTYRVIADQANDHPFKAFATAAIEACGNDMDFTTGFVTQFPEDDDAPNRSIDVQEIIDSVPSVELRGYPKGYKNGIIAQQTDLTYKFILSNTGTDTVDRIVIRDTLSDNLQLSTLQMGASSHPYTFEVYNQGILKITFASDTQDLAYVEFKIAQKPGNPAGTVINNRASIFFDYQTPLISNQVQHVINAFPGFVEVVVDTDNPLNLGVKMDVYPNPFLDIVRFDIIGRTDLGPLKFSVFDLNGRLIDQKQYTGNQFFYNRHPNLKTGLYIFKLESAGQLIGSGKLLAQ